MLGFTLKHEKCESSVFCRVCGGDPEKGPGLGFLAEIATGPSVVTRSRQADPSRLVYERNTSGCRVLKAREHYVATSAERSVCAWFQRCDYPIIVIRCNWQWQAVLWHL